MIEHTPWVGSEYDLGVDGQKIAIVGYSHWLGDNDPDTTDTTVDVMQKVVTGEYPDIAFFNLIRGYFGDDAASAFWNKVMFFNFVPEAIGLADHRYDVAGGEQQRSGQCRFLRLMKEHSPHKVLVFTSKGWSQMPPLREFPNGESFPLGSEFPGVTWGTYQGDPQPIMAFGLRHTQFARGELLRSAVRRILEMRPRES